MEDDDVALSGTAYDHLLRRHPWILSRDPYAYLCRGWVDIATVMLDAIDEVMAGIVVAHPGAGVLDWSTKEKLGGLRVFFGLEGAPAEVWPAVRAPVDAAEEASKRICERCGAPGRIRDVGGWLTAVCDDHAG